MAAAAVTSPAAIHRTGLAVTVRPADGTMAEFAAMLREQLNS